MATESKDKGNNPTLEPFTTIATKTHDGGANPRNGRPPSGQLVRKHEDPFMYYSHQETRMKSLLLTDEGEESNERVAGELDVRKTKISFELHPSLVLESLFLQDHHAWDNL